MPQIDLQPGKEATSNQAVVLEMRNISKTFKNEAFKKNRVALNNLSVTFARGKCTGFLGHNGAGKTTAIRIILGILFPSKGEVEFEGKPLTVEGKKKIGYMPEVNKLPGNLTPQEILRNHLALFCSDRSKADREALIDEKLKQVRIFGHHTKRLKHLSKGMGRRVAWLQASIHKPSLLILDEPFSGLDPLGRIEMQSWIEEEKMRGTSIVLCTHELWTVDALCDHIYVVRNGELAFSSTDGMGTNNSQSSASYSLQISGATEDAIRKIQQSAKLPPFASLKQDGWASSLRFSEYNHGTAWLKACIDQGYLVISFNSDASRSESYLLQYFSQAGG
jgi:ABC-2 type transport system ATP-binding protein